MSDEATGNKSDGIEEKNEKLRAISVFRFVDDTSYERALKEVQGIKYIKDRMTLEDPKRVLAIYNKIVADKMFETPVGLSFMYELGEFLMSAGINQEGLAGLEVEGSILVDEVRKKRKQEADSLSEKKRLKKELKATKKRFSMSVLIGGVLAAAMVAMLIIAARGETVTVLNYRNRIINEYESWEEELEQREQAVEEYEEKYGIIREDE